jgi:hypothetical protein
MKVFLCLLFGAMLVGGVVTDLRVASAQEVDMTYDGLVRSDKRGLKGVWIKPGIDFSHYTGILFDAPEFEFRLPGTVEDRRFRQQQFVLTPDDKQGLSEMALRIFKEEAQKIQHYRLTDEPGPDVIIVRIRILDVLKIVPTEADDPSMDITRMRSVTEATQVAEVHDSLSGEIIARSVDQGGKAYAGGVASARSRDWAPLEKPVRNFAKEIRERLDKIHEK